MLILLITKNGKTNLALQSQDALRSVLSPPLFTYSSIDSCVPTHCKKQNKMASFFSLSVKGIAVPNVLMLAEN